MVIPDTFKGRNSLMKIITNDVEIHIEDHGAGVPALIFLHYWGGSSRTWQHTISALDGTYRTVAIDQRGWGQSDKHASGYSLSDLAGDAQSVIAALHLDRYILVGHSMGGKVAQLMASRRPQGLAGLVLVAPSPPSPLGLPLDVRQGMVSAYDTRESVVATVEQVLAATALDPADLEIIIADSLVGAPAAKEAWPLFSSQEDITEDVSNIAVPTIVISGKNDRVDPPSVLMKELLPRISIASLHLLPGVGHLSPLEAPEELGSLIKTFAEGIDNTRN
jgi:pimeloyl-ACP methyl ester carboxylesterase